MRLSTVFELLLIFLLIAFAAYGRVIDQNRAVSGALGRPTAHKTNQHNFGISFMSLKQATENVNRHCTCNENICNCCRNFHIPVVRLQGPGCASLQYLKEDNLAVQLSFGDNILTSTVISGKKARAICVPMPGGLSKFCGRIYNIQREAENNFKACLGLELQSGSELEASLRVSCFRFGPDGLQLRPAEQLPILETSAKPESDEDDDDDYDIFDLDDDTPDADEDAPVKNTQPLPSNTPASDSADDDDDDDDDDDILGFGALLDIITGDDDREKKKTSTAPPILPFTIPIITKPPTTPATVAKPATSANTQSHNATPSEIKKPTKMPDLPNNNPQDTADSETTEITTNEVDKLDTTESISDDTTISDASPTEVPTEGSPEEAANSTTKQKPADTDESSTTVETVVNSERPSSVKKIIGIKTNKKSSITSSSLNAIVIDSKKPVKPAKPDPVPAPTHNSEELEEDYILSSSDADEDEYAENADAESAEVEVEDEYDEDEDEEEEEEDAVLTALVSDDKEQSKDEKLPVNTLKPQEDDSDYGIGLDDLLARKQTVRRGRQSKIMRL